MSHKAVGPIRATLRGIGDIFKGSKSIGRLAQDDRIDGRNCLVTGANRGLGKAIAIELAERGGRVFMAGRTVDEKARSHIMKKGHTEYVENMHCDLADLGSVRGFVDDVRSRGLIFDIVVVNAGIVNLAPRRSKYGLDEMFVVNYLSNFLLLNLLLSSGCIADTLRDSNHSCRFRPRIVLVSSEAHRWAREIEIEEIGSFKEGSIRSVMPLYSNDKLFLTTFGQELASRLAGNGESNASVHSFCPGAVRTGIARQAPFWAKPVLALVFFLFFRSPKRASKPAVFLCCSRDIEEETGLYLHIMTHKPADPRVYDMTFRKALWAKSEDLLHKICETT